MKRSLCFVKLALPVLFFAACNDATTSEQHEIKDSVSVQTVTTTNDSVPTQTTTVTTQTVTTQTVTTTPVTTTTVVNVPAGSGTSPSSTKTGGSKTTNTKNEDTVRVVRAPGVKNQRELDSIKRSRVKVPQ